MHRILLLVVMVLASASPSAGAAQVGIPREAAAAVDSLFAAHARPDVPGYVLGVVRDGRLVFSRAYGSASLEHGVPLTTRSVFHLASLSKQFTGAAVALLVLEGKLSLEDPVQKFVPAVA
jgi:CubicO group peptidase (beta-lactamase class C family)